MSRISFKTRQFVRERAHFNCEYCLTPELFSFIGYEVDHIISRKHGGQNDVNNLAWSCSICNYRKGTDVGTILQPKQVFVRLFNPRIDIWGDHFKLSNLTIEAKTDIGEATIKVP